MYNNHEALNISLKGTMRSHQVSLYVICLLLVLSGCVLPAKLTYEPPSLPTRYAQIQQTLTPGNHSVPNAILTGPTPEPQPTKLPTQKQADLEVYLHPGLPESLLKALPLEEYQVLSEPNQNSPQISLASLEKAELTGSEAIWTYALVTPFFTLMDEISFQNLQALWSGQTPQGIPISNIYLTAADHAAMTEVLGSPDPDTVKMMEWFEILEKSLSMEDFLAIIPFENLAPQLKILRIDGTSPIEQDFDPLEYKLSVSIRVEGGWPGAPLPLLPGNYDPEHRTVMILTGVTALTRATAHQMATRGEKFPGQDIRSWLLAADITHISHEVPFSEDCPDPDPVQEDLIFCASPERIALLEDIDADVIELSGNHLLDYGESAARLTIQMYRDRGWLTYAGGLDLLEAQTPAKIAHNGNKFAFMGCNLPGPPNVWAAASKAGAASCGDFGWLEAAIQKAQSEGYLPIVTLQYNEDYSAVPGPQMEHDFLRLAESGAVVVTGSQAHTPKLMSFHQDSFVHFGLGNLFFDQMAVYYQDVLMDGTRDEFLDRLVFYDNRLVSVELLTAKLEDYARPRPMTADERAAFLEKIFDLAFNFHKERSP